MSLDYTRIHDYFVEYKVKNFLHGLQDLQFNVGNYNPLFQLFPIHKEETKNAQDSIAAIKNADTWKNIENYHEHLDFDAQDKEAHAITNLIFESINKFHKKDRILEIGCGSGRNIHALGKKFPDAEVVGIDINAAASFVTSFSSNVSFIQGNVLDFDFSDLGLFDVVLTSGFLMHINHADVKSVIETMVRISRNQVVFELHGQSSEWDFHRYPRDYSELFVELGFDFQSYQVFIGHPTYSYELTPSFAHSLLIR
jgi:ubiquinone/menaquinone biosynthesis C-methylase UbiE